MATAIGTHSSGRSTGSKAALIIRQVRILFSAYRRDEFADPEGFVTQIGVVLEEYPEDVIVYVTHPRTGLQRRSKWPPSIAEVVEACDEEVARLAKIAKYRAMGEVQKMLPAPRAGRCNFDEMVAKHGRPIGIGERGTVFEQYAGRAVGGQKQELKRMTADDLRRIYARHDEAVV